MVPRRNIALASPTLCTKIDLIIGVSVNGCKSCRHFLKQSCRYIPGGWSTLKQCHLGESVGADPRPEWLQRSSVDHILRQEVPDDNAGRVERVLIAVDMAERLYETLCMSSGCSSWWMEWTGWQVDQVWHHTEHHNCPSPEPSPLKAFQLEITEHSCYAAFLSIYSL